MTGVRALQAEATRQSIIDAASALFVERGYDRTSVDDVIARSGTSKGAVYHQFSDKRDIYEACFRASQTRIIGRMRGAVDAGVPAWDRARLGTRFFLESYVSDAEARSLLTMAAGVLGARRAHEVDAEISLPFVSGLLSELSGVAAPGDLELVVRILMAAICEGATAIASAPTPTSTAIEASRVIEAMIAGVGHVLAQGTTSPSS